MDGVIVDSAQAHNASWAAMAEEFGVPYDPDNDFKAIFGRHNTDIISSLWHITDPEQIEKMALNKETHFRQSAARLRPLPGVVELMQALKAAGWKQGIGSSAPPENLDLLIRGTGITRYINAVASGADVKNGKPDPEVFLVAFQRLGVEPRNGVVIEDAPAGVQAARRAGAACLAVTNTQNEQTLREAGADLVVATLKGVSPDTLERLIARNHH
jgi:HAD superfamily hydrolase (TIGR01509 family)